MAGTDHQYEQAASLAELAALFASRHGNRNTRLAYQSDVDRFIQWCDARGVHPLALGPHDLDTYRVVCQGEGTSPATVARRLAALSSFYTVAVEQGALAESPLASVARPATAPSGTGELDADEAAALVAAGVRCSPKTALLVDLLLLDGVKLGEALAADAADVTIGPAPDGAGVTGSIGSTGSTGSAAATIMVSRRRGPAEVSLQGLTAEAAQEYLQGRRQGPLLLSDSASGRSGAPPARLTRFGADYLLKRASEEAGFDRPVSANVLRRSYVAMAHANGDSVEEIRDHLGHHDTRTTRRHLANPPAPPIPPSDGAGLA